MVRLPIVAVPPRNRRTMATPRLAPASMPRMDGPARGLRKAVCRSRPQVPNAAPVSRAVSICGNRPWRTIMLQAGCPSTSPPQTICQTSRTGMSSEPHNIFAIARTARPMVRNRSCPLPPSPKERVFGFVIIRFNLLWNSPL